MNKSLIDYFNKTNIDLIVDTQLLTTFHLILKSIKECSQHYQFYLDTIISLIGNLNEQTLFSKKAINDSLICLSQVKPRLSMNTNEIYLKEKMYILSERMDKVQGIHHWLNHHVKQFDITLTFYFQTIKNICIQFKQILNQIKPRTQLNSKTDIKPNKIKSVSVPIKNVLNLNQKDDSVTTITSLICDYKNVKNKQCYDIIKQNVLTDIALNKYKIKELEQNNDYLQHKLKQLNQEKKNVLANLKSQDKNLNILNHKHKLKGVSQIQHQFINQLDTEEVNKCTESKPKRNEYYYTIQPIELTLSQSSFNKLENYKRAFSIDNKKKNNSMNLSKLPEFSKKTLSQTLTKSNSANNNVITQIISLNDQIKLNDIDHNNRTIAHLVLSFLSQMQNLQECISKKDIKINEMKKQFEMQKMKLYKVAKEITNPNNNQTNINITKTQKNNYSPHLNEDDIITNINQLNVDNLEIQKALHKKEKQLLISESKLSKNENKYIQSKAAYEQQIKDLKNIIQKQKNTINQFEQINTNLSETIQKSFQNNNDISKTIKEKQEPLQNSQNLLQNQIKELLNENKELKDELNLLKKEIVKIKTNLKESNQNICIITKANEAILNEKEHIITNLTNNTFELNKEIEILVKETQTKQKHIVFLESQIKAKETISNAIKLNNNKESLLISETSKKYQQQLSEVQQYNKQLIIKIEQLQLLNNDQTKEQNMGKDNVQIKLINIIKEAEININNIQIKNEKLKAYKTEYQNKLYDKIKEQSYTELSEEYSIIVSLIKQYNNEMIKLNDMLKSKVIKRNFSSYNTIHKDELSIERKYSQSSLNSYDESIYQLSLKKMEENEILFQQQLITLKTELKSTIEERDKLKKQIEKAFVFSTKDELFKILKQTFEKLIDLIQVAGKVKDYVMMILKLLNYPDDEITKIITRKDKKHLFGLFQ